MKSQCSAVWNRDVATYLIHIIVIEHPNSKGQLISKGSLVFSILPKKRTQNFCPSRLKINIFKFVFWEN